MSTKLGQIAKKATGPRGAFSPVGTFTDTAFLKETWRMMNRHAASGVDGQSTEQFASEMEPRVEEICAQLKEGTYARRGLRGRDPKGPGKIGTRPLGESTVDRLLQRAVARILEAVFETDFLDWQLRLSTRAQTLIMPCRLCAAYVTKKVSHVLRRYPQLLHRIDHQWLRIADPIILQLISKWLKAGHCKTESSSQPRKGPRKGVHMPVLSNLYLHLRSIYGCEENQYCVEARHTLVRFADDFVGCFQFQDDAQNFQRSLRERFARFNLELAEDKTRDATLWTFCRHHAGQAWTEARRLSSSASSMSVGWIGAGVRLDPVSPAQELQKVSRSHPRVAARASALKRREQQQHLRVMLRGFYSTCLHHCDRRLSWNPP